MLHTSEVMFSANSYKSFYILSSVRVRRQRCDLRCYSDMWNAYDGCGCRNQDVTRSLKWVLSCLLQYTSDIHCIPNKSCLLLEDLEPAFPGCMHTFLLNWR